MSKDYTINKANKIIQNYFNFHKGLTDEISLNFECPTSLKCDVCLLNDSLVGCKLNRYKIETLERVEKYLQSSHKKYTVDEAKVIVFEYLSTLIGRPSFVVAETFLHCLAIDCSKCVFNSDKHSCKLSILDNEKLRLAEIEIERYNNAN